MILILKNVIGVRISMEKKYFGIPTEEGAIGKNAGCKDAPKFLFDLFNIKGALFELEGELEKKQEQIFLQGKKIFEEKDLEKLKPIFFGGTHDITSYLFKAFAEKKENAKLLIFDAHADCEDALPLITTHEDFVRMLIETKIIAPENLMIVGLRKVSEIEKEFLKTNKIKHFYFEELKTSFETFVKIVNAFSNSGELYVSFDVDVLDSKLMQATGYFPDGGLSVEEAKELLEVSFQKAKVFDLAEFNPSKIKLKEDIFIKKLFSSFFD